MAKIHGRAAPTVKQQALAVVLGLLVLGGAGLAYGDDAEDDFKARVKAALVAKVVRFTKWPGGPAGARARDPLVVGLLGEDPTGDALEDALVPSVLKVKEVKFRVIAGPGDLKGCHVLWIAGSNEADLDELLKALRTLPILTVSDGEGFLDRGVQVRVGLAGDTMGFGFNLAALHRSELVVPSQVLKLAQRVIKDEDEAKGQGGGE